MIIRNVIWGVACFQLLLSCSTTAPADSEMGLWAKLQTGGYVLLLLHASAMPATRQPPSLPHADCSGLDTLSDLGQLEARRLKEHLQRHGVSLARVLTSHDCRCVQTAGIVFGLAEPWSIIDDAVNDDTSTGTEKQAALREAIGRWSSDGNLVLVSHRSNFQQAIGAYPDEKQLLVIQPLGDYGFRLLGRLNVD